MPVLKKVDQILQPLQQKGLCYKTTVLPRETLTHPANRGGSLLNPQDVWSKGLRMVSIGIQPALLQEGGVAFELSTEAGKRDQQVAANVTLVESADGALAPVTKTERQWPPPTQQPSARQWKLAASHLQVDNLWTSAAVFPSCCWAAHQLRAPWGLTRPGYIYIYKFIALSYITCTCTRFKYIEILRRSVCGRAPQSIVCGQSPL